MTYWNGKLIEDMETSHIIATMAMIERNLYYEAKNAKQGFSDILTIEKDEPLNVARKKCRACVEYKNLETELQRRVKAKTVSISDFLRHTKIAASVIGKKRS